MGKVVVVGGGAAGMAAAIGASEAGHQVALYEKTKSLERKYTLPERAAAM